jgi:hypothetical protein
MKSVVAILYFPADVVHSRLCNLYFLQNEHKYVVRWGTDQTINVKPVLHGPPNSLSYKSLEYTLWSSSPSFHRLSLCILYSQSLHSTGTDYSFVYKDSLQTQHSSHQPLKMESERVSSKCRTPTPHWQLWSSKKTSLNIFVSVCVEENKFNWKLMWYKTYILFIWDYNIMLYES